MGRARDYVSPPGRSPAASGTAHWLARSRRVRAPSPNSGRDHRQHHPRIVRAAGVQRHGAVEDLRWAVARVVVQERADAGELVLHVRELATGAAGIGVVLAPHGEGDAVAGRKRDAGRPDLDVELVDLARLERLLGLVGMVGTPGLRALRIEF